MQLLAIISGEYGRRHVDNIRAHGPEDWHIEVWKAPSPLPPVIDDPEEFLPHTLPHADLILSFAEHPGVAELLPEIVRMTGARAVLVAVDSEKWLPPGLAHQLREWLREMGVVCVTPKPLCSLAPNHYLVGRRQKVEYDDPLLAEFTRYFGKPELKIEVDPKTRTIISVEVVRDAVCGCARYVAQNLVGVSADDAEEKAGLLHHHYPCLASMDKDPAYGDTLMHVSGNILKEQVGEQVKPFRQIQYIIPGVKAE
ncbi:MAG: DUF166 family protein [Anaerolineae bacterium]|nr:thymidylate synthase [Anaerolineae bacterium]MDW8102412.1 DUF166 family protein [Anaerolineae bacterium]